MVYCLFNYNPMYSLLFFILFLFSTVLLLLSQNMEFLALLVALIYFGAILILFFFVILLINLQVVTRDNLHNKKVPVLSLIFIYLLFLFFKAGQYLGLFIKSTTLNQYNSNLTLETLSFTMFNNFSTHIIVLGLILFLGLIGLVLILVNNTSLNLTYLRKSI